MRVRLAELIAALSLATDLGLGLPQEHVLRQCRIALGLAERMGLSPAERAAIYHVALLAWVGCTADSHELAAQFGDDIALRADTYDIELAGAPLASFLLRRVGTGQAPLRRAQMAAAFVTSGGEAASSAMTAHCQVASLTAARFGLGPDVQRPLIHMFERWDGRGTPNRVRGEELPLATRIAQVADIVEVHHRRGGIEAAVAVAQARAGGHFDPDVVEAFCEHAPELLDWPEDESSWDAVIGAEPALATPLTDAALDDALTAVADFADLKSPWFTGHSRGVARLAAAAADHAGLPDEAVVELRRAALVHDLGRAGVPNTIWDKPGPLNEAERERVRLHPYYTQRMLARPESLAKLGALAGSHHERMDGSGYHRSLPGTILSPAARILAAADVYHALTEARPHREAFESGAAAKELRREVTAGRIDAAAADEVLAAAGHARTSSRERARPAGLTARELEVLLLVARGASSREVAAELVIADKTARNHIERIYRKLGVSTRAEASLFAMRQGLID